MVVKSFNGLAINDSTNYEAFLIGRLPYGLHPVQAQMLMRTGRRPKIAGIQRPGVLLSLRIFIRAGSSITLSQTFDPDDETAKTLIVEDVGGANDRTLEAICLSLTEEPGSPKEYVAVLQVDGDPAFHIAASADVWNLTASGETHNIANSGQMRAWPVLQIKPTSAKTGGYDYRRWIQVEWPYAEAVEDYPLDILNNGLDTATLIGAAKMQADGDDLRVFVDGAEVDRWLQDINTATTQCWVNLDFSPAASATLGVAIASSGAITEIEASTDISTFPNSGLLLIDSEVFSYMGIDQYSKKFTGVTRAMRGTSMAAHTTTDTIYWIQHDIWIVYGNSGVSAPTVDSDAQPVIELTSLNNSWVYNNFGGTAIPKPWSWSFEEIIDSLVFISDQVDGYTGDRGATADPWVEIGVHVDTVQAGIDGYSGTYKGRWSLGHPGLISNANFTSGEKYYQGQWNASIQSSDDDVTWAVEYSIPTPSSQSAWESWSRSEAIANLRYVGLYASHQISVGGGIVYAEASSVTLTLVTVPTVTIGSEIANYSLDAVLTNNTTGISFRITYPLLSLNQSVEIDTENFTVTELETGLYIFGALTPLSGIQSEWFWLATGTNQLQYDETGAAAVTVTTNFDKRYYE